MLIKRDNPYALAAKYLFALSKCKKNKSDPKLCKRLHKLGVVARDLAYQRDVVVSEDDFAVIRQHRMTAVAAYPKKTKDYDGLILDEM